MIAFAGASSNVIEGDYIGLGASGSALGNGADGVVVQGGATNNTIGGTATGSADVISANGQHGVLITDANTVGNVVEGDFIGTDATGTRALGNHSDGVHVSGLAGNVVGNAFGQTNPGAGNTIAFNGANGFASDGSTESSTILGNSIFSNGGLGISEAAGTGATLEPAPTLQAPVTSGGTTTVHGTTTGAPVKGGMLIIQFFASPSGNQGKVLVGQVTVTTDAKGNASFSIALSSAAVAGQVITATATDQTFGTSIFSNAVPVPATGTGVDIQGQPSDTVLGHAIAPIVRVLVVDRAGNTVRRSHPWVRISVLSGPAGARLIGRTTVRAVHGVATFRGLKLNEAGTYTLTVTSPGLTPDISNVFTVSRRR